MITEIARIDVPAGKSEDFVAAVQRARALFDNHPECGGVSLMKSADVADRFWLMVRWSSVEAHMVTFRQSEEFAEWRALVGEYLVQPVELDHAATLF